MIGGASAAGRMKVYYVNIKIDEASVPTVGTEEAYHYFYMDHTGIKDGANKPVILSNIQKTVKNWQKTESGLVFPDFLVYYTHKHTSCWMIGNCVEIVRDIGRGNDALKSNMAILECHREI